MEQLVRDYFHRILLVEPDDVQLERWANLLELADDFKAMLEDFRVSLLTQATEVRSIIQLYAVVFDRKPDFEGLWFWTNVLRDVQEANPDLSYDDQMVILIVNWLESEEFVERFGGNLSNDDFVDLLYHHILGREPDEEGFSHWTEALDAGLSREALIVLFSESQEFSDSVVDAANGLLTAAAALTSATELDDPDYIIPGNDPYQGRLQNNAPTDIVIKDDLIVYDNAVEDGTVVGSVLRAVDLDGGDAHTFTLINDGGGAFRLTNTEPLNPTIIVADARLVGLAAANSIAVEIEVTDKNGGKFSKEFEIALSGADGRYTPPDLSNYFSYGTDPQGNDIPADITGWDVSHVVDMYRMFFAARTFNQDIGSWDTSKVADMSGMFLAAIAFNQDIGSWNTASVTDLSSMFSGATIFNQNIGSWNISNVEYLSNMFYNAPAFNQEISDWDVTKVKILNFMLYEAKSFNQDISDWNISSLIGAENMLNHSGMDTVNFDRLLAGWSALNTDAGETAIRSAVKLGAYGLTYTDLTSYSVLSDSYGWTIAGASLLPSVTAGTAGGETLGNSGSLDDQIIHALGGDDFLNGGAGADVLNGGYGNDTLTGGSEADVFIFQDGFYSTWGPTAGRPTGYGEDTITDFIAGEDVINLTYVMSINDFTDLTANHLTQSGNDAVITDAHGNTITLTGVTATDLTADDFIFF